ncbi:iron ABC transporter permease [Marinomonas sp. RSW2]|uniref:Iron ABC transporter permease n=1 Tax=Marinomonas maritima TaxID=2940935 RepID=A0ABT5WJ37_9GAMM|nr:iron ABC transporter permease [Marinomonas maritima]MDE8604804.1 iron ABC transporter permease [Marinomonas maritima]
MKTVVENAIPESPKPKRIYAELNRSRLRFISLTAVALILIIMADLGVGASWMNVSDVLNTLWLGPSGDSLHSTIIWQLRLPLTLTCLVVGASLGLAGGLMQTLLANPLASPYTLGVSAAAGFGAAVAMLSGLTIFGHAWLGIPVSAFITSALSTLAIFFIGKGRNMDPKVLILAGIVVLFFFQALQSLVQYMASPEVLQQIVFWLFGSLLKASWTSVWVAGVILIFSLVYVAPQIWALTALSAGDERAQSLGIRTEKLRLRMFFLCSLLTAGAVSFVGTIGFIGLVAPHLSRMLVGEDQRFYLPMATMMGALVLALASLVSKLVVPGTIIPIGIVTSLVGVPFLLYLLVSKRFA